ncbi:CLUMA_CG017697, isoform A [Clunio marinus]|uniref:CLUMA_CG017697, isoform A n=1 Tax=Clunio marinus TaxID=568069 RepID=A0A1J1IWN8_9DIPT|nr:CLUMA_CG017697, isoform A [Clunio marinus]
MFKKFFGCCSQKKKEPAVRLKSIRYFGEFHETDVKSRKSAIVVGFEENVKEFGVEGEESFTKLHDEKDKESDQNLICLSEETNRIRPKRPQIMKSCNKSYKNIPNIAEADASVQNLNDEEVDTDNNEANSKELNNIHHKPDELNENADNLTNLDSMNKSNIEFQPEIVIENLIFKNDEITSKSLPMDDLIQEETNACAIEIVKENNETKSKSTQLGGSDSSLFYTSFVSKNYIEASKIFNIEFNCKSTQVDEIDFNTIKIEAEVHAASTPVSDCIWNRSWWSSSEFKNFSQDSLDSSIDSLDNPFMEEYDDNENIVLNDLKQEEEDEEATTYENHFYDNPTNAECMKTEFAIVNEVHKPRIVKYHKKSYEATSYPLYLDSNFIEDDDFDIQGEYNILNN